jgi:hypothetical protein
MSAVEKATLEGRALEEALRRYQEIWNYITALDAQSVGGPNPSPRLELRYDATVLKDFLANLPEALRSDVGTGREFIHQTLRCIRIESGGRRVRQCPVCGKPLAKPTPQHMAKHGRTPPEAYSMFPALGFTRGARLLIEPSPEGLLNTSKVFGLVVAGAGFEPATFGL